MLKFGRGKGKMKRKIMASIIVCMLVFVGLSVFSTAGQPCDSKKNTSLIPPVWKTFLIGKIANSYSGQDATYGLETLNFTAIFVIGMATDTTSGGGPEFYSFRNQDVAVYKDYSKCINTGTFIVGVFNGKPIVT